MKYSDLIAILQKVVEFFALGAFFLGLLFNNYSRLILFCETKRNIWGREKNAYYSKHISRQHLKCVWK